MSGLEQWSSLHLPNDLYPLIHDNGMVCLNTATNTYQSLDCIGSTLLQALHEVGTIEPLTLFYANRSPDPDSRQAHVLAWLEKAATKGLVAPGSATTPKVLPRAHVFTEDEINGAGEVVLAVEDVDYIAVNFLEKQTAQEALEEAVVLARQPFKEIARVITQRNTLATPLATPQEATRILGSIRQIPPSYALGRVACLERTIAAVLCGAAQNKRIDMAIGVKLDPNAGHAWPAVAGTAIRLAADPQIAGQYHELLRLVPNK